MEQLKRGNKRSSWLTFKRRLLIVRLLLRGPQSKADLIRAVQQQMGEDGYPSTANNALKSDLDALRTEFGCEIRFQRRIQGYDLRDLGELALLDLPDAGITALSFLDASFPEGDALPEYAHLRSLLNQILLLLPPERRIQVQQRQTMSLDLGALPADRLNPQVLRQLQRAVRRQELSFEYRSNMPEGQRTWQRVAPYGIVFRPDGHVYLDATTLEVSPKPDTLRLPIDTLYRVERILPESIQVLAQTLPPKRPRTPAYTVRYRLVPEVARRRDLAPIFPDTQITYHEDGSASVVATAANLWQARQSLLRYGSACIVTEPPELVDLFRKAAREMATNYDVL